ncbi:hypothetical protein AKJ53_01395 [candidate division MSBL1 archaeon SCGC-AAA382F02]|uniref:UPF0201 protein AKJ53_01395 n=1 Tax=candidate division MSBL1 archaeon SCGC-AAA382F02 TaxID=1698282 RepID=A0A133VI12_9EURY|nr:hypothetical protein AKJ53_01395 [candidate division MSBL1 archaeon SCGC-AAA382F02]
MKIEVKAKIHPSEDPDKVTESVKNIFPEIDLSVKENQVKGKSTNKNSLEKLKNKIGLQAIRDTARKELEKNRENQSIQFSLNKQVATVDKVNFSTGETPLGSIEVRIEAKDIEELIDYLVSKKEER